MKNFYQNIILTISVILLHINFIYGQTFNSQSQNRSWSANNNINTVFFKTSGVDLSITPNLNMIQFVDSNGATYGYNGDNDIPTDWTYEILDGNADLPANTTVSGDKKTITFTADPDEDLDIYLKISDTNGNVIDNLSRVQLRLYIRGNLTVSTASWNACEQAFILSVNEQTRDGNKLCAPYRIIVYSVVNGSIDTNTVIYDSNNDNNHNVNSNKFSLSLGVGSYAAVITNSCNERVNSSSDGYYYFSVTEAYTFGASSVFSGYQCITDNIGTTVIKIEGAAKEITWELKNSSGQVILTNSDSNQYNLENYNDQFDTQNFTITIPNLAEGTYTFTFTDGNSCTEDLTFKIEKPEEIEASLDQDNSKLQLACYGDSDGKITFFANGGWTEPWDGNYINPNGWGDPYTFTLSKSGSTYTSGDVVRHFVNGSQTAYKTSFTGLSAGTYTLTVRENVATNPYNSNTIYYCAKVFEQTFTITEPAQLVASGSISDNNGFGISCNGADDGSIDLSVSGGTANYTYAWTKTGDNSYSATSQDLSSLSPGTYNVTVTDANNCTTTNSFTITEPDELTIADAGLSTEIACFGDNGQIRVNITQGSVAGYTYALYQGNSVVQTITNSNLNHTFSAAAGTYKVRVTDANGCFKETSNITLTQPDAGLTISSETVNNIDCKDDDNGSISITTTGGTANYTFQWIKIGDGNYSATSKDISNLSPGVYAVTITDANGCTLSKSFSVTEPETLTSSASVTNIDCNGNDNGSIDLSVSGGTANYTYAWTKTGDNSYSATSQDLSSLSPGTYNVTVTDANNCTTTNSFTITEPDELTIADAGLSTEIACFGDNGQIRVNITQGSVAGYTYALYQGNSVVQTITNSNLNHTFSAAAGTYKVRVTDANGCFKETSNITLTQPDAGLSISNNSTNNVSCNGADDGSIDISVSGGSAGLIGYGSMTDGLYKTLNGGYTWNKIHDIQHSATNFFNNRVGYSNFTTNSNTNKTTNSGIDWTQLSQPSLDDFSFVSEEIGYAHDSSKTYKTSDGGQSWQVVNDVAYYDLSFVNESIGYGRNFAENRGTYKTIDGGVTWSKVNEIAYIEYEFTSELIGYARSQKTPGSQLESVHECQCEDGTYKTIDGGKSWNKISSTVYTFLSFVDDNLGYGIEWPVGGGEGGKIHKTNDGGINWTLINSDLDANGENYSHLSFPKGQASYTIQWTKSVDSNFSANTEDISNLSPGTYTVTITDSNGCSVSNTYTITQPDELTSSASFTNIDCNGNDNGSIDLSVAGGTANYTYAWTKTGDNSYSATTQDLNNLSPGTYNVTITDANDCTATNSFTIIENAELSLTSSVPKTNGFEISCFGGTDGSISVTMTGGTGNYTYNWSTNNGSGLVQGQEDQSGLSKGDYSLTVTDSNGCSVVSNFTLNSPDEIVLTSTKSNFNGFNVSCNGDNNGSIDITVNGGYLDSNTNYTYSWTTNNGSGLNPNNEDQTGLTAGTYTVVATDTNGCSITQNIEITEPDSLAITEIISDYNGFQISEAGENDGSIDITISGGSSNYSYQWSTNNGSGLNSSSEDQTGLIAGTYTVTATDTNGCQIIKDYTLSEPKELIIAIDHNANGNSVLCYGDTTASIKIDVTQESISPYDYSISGTTYLNQQYNETASNISASTYSFINLPAGQYTISVVDANGVSKSTNKEIFGPESPLTMTSNISAFGNFNISCPGANDATIDLSISGGGGSSNQATYFYSWSTFDGSGLNSSAEDQSGLGPGTYTVVVKDINDCSITETFTITQAPPLTYNLDSTKNITCFGDNDGEINITVGGGTGNYTYEWSTENGSGLIQGQEDQSGLGPGDYKLLLRDGCNTFEYIYTISTPDTLEIVQDEKVNILCHDDSTGKIYITVTGGTAPYNYVWKDNFGNVYDRNVGNVFNDGDLSNIPSGVYDLTVTDANGCIDTFSTELTQPEDLVIDVQKTDLNCYNSNNGTITITPSGGIAPYSYSWSDFGNGNERTGLAAGIYTVIITDSNGCAETRTIEVENADLFDVNPVVTPISCFGADDGSIELNFEGGVLPITFRWNDDTTAGQNRYNLSPGVYSVLIQDSSGCEIQRDFTIIEPQEISIAGVITNAIDCDNPASGSIDLQISGGNPPYTFQWSNGATTEDISGLIANNYLVIVTDSKGCSTEKEFVINRQEDLEIDLSTDLYAICETREVYQKNIVSVSGGVAPYVIQWSNGIVTGNNNEIMDTKIEGSYQVTVTDALGCSESIIFQVSTPEIGFPDFSYDSFYLSTYGALAVNDVITFTNLSTEQYFNVLWEFGDGNNSQEINPSHTYTKRGVYDVTLTVEFILGCSYSITKTIYVGDTYEIVIPNAFTPNNDGYNDTFRPVYYGFKYLKMQIFDTWGNLIYNEESTSNELNGWNGRINGKDGENGNYFYQVSGNTHTNEKFSQNGAFTLIK